MQDTKIQTTRNNKDIQKKHLEKEIVNLQHQLVS
jgi:hypothetical protein